MDHLTGSRRSIVQRIRRQDLSQRMKGMWGRYRCCPGLMPTRASTTLTTAGSLLHTVMDQWIDEGPDEHSQILKKPSRVLFKNTATAVYKSVEEQMQGQGQPGWMRGHGNHQGHTSPLRSDHRTMARQFPSDRELIVVPRLARLD